MEQTDITVQSAIARHFFAKPLALCLCASRVAWQYAGHLECGRRKRA